MGFPTALCGGVDLGHRYRALAANFVGNVEPDNNFVGTSDDDISGDGNSLTGNGGADDFDCGPGTDTIQDYTPAFGDTKTADCENF